MRPATLRRLVFCVSLLLPAQLAWAQFQMPDPKQMSGIPRPVTDLPDTSISIRVIRGQLSNNVQGQTVELHVGGKTLTAKTDEGGRAEFDKLPANSMAKAVAVVDGERLESQEFPIPAQGGVRMMLVATDKAAKAEPAPTEPVDGQVVFGGQTRFVIEPGDEEVRVYYLLEIVNTARAPVRTARPVMFDMPTGAVGTTLLEGSSPLASVKGTRVIVLGPYPPGKTAVQVGTSIPSFDDSMTIETRLPANVEQMAAVVKKVGPLRFTSPQVTNQQEMTAEGDRYIAATGGTIPAGQPIVFVLNDLPHHSMAPRRTALLLAAMILVAGVWLGTRTPEPATRATERQRLVARREKLLKELVRLDADERRGRLDATAYRARREELVSALEHVYGALDDDSGPGPADAGLAA